MCGMRQRKSILHWGRLAVLLIKILIKIHLTFCGAINTPARPAAAATEAAPVFSNAKIYAKNSKFLVNKILPQTHTHTQAMSLTSFCVCVCASFKPTTLAERERERASGRGEQEVNRNFIKSTH